MITNIKPESQLKKPFNGIVKEHKKSGKLFSSNSEIKSFCNPVWEQNYMLSAEMGVCRLVH